MKKLGTKRDKSLWDRLVNEKFGGEYPVLSPEASVEAALRLYRKAMGKPFSGKIKLTSGNRRTWVRNGVMSVNPDERIWTGSRGLREIIHSISHLAHRHLHPLDAPHSRRQAQLEGRLVTYAIKSGWLEPGKLKPTKKTLARLEQAKKTKRKRRADPDHTALKRKMKELGMTGRIEREGGYTDFVIQPNETFPKGFKTIHYDWAETLDRFEEAVRDPSALDRHGWLSR